MNAIEIINCVVPDKEQIMTAVPMATRARWRKGVPTKRRVVVDEVHEILILEESSTGGWVWVRLEHKDDDDDDDDNK